VRAIRARESIAIAERKKSLAAMLANVAELGASRMEETVGKVGCRDAAIVTGIATDKMLALAGQMPVSTQVAVIQMLTPEQNERRRRINERLMRLRACSQTGTVDREGRTHDTNAALRFEYLNRTRRKARNRARMPADAPSLLSLNSLGSYPSCDSHWS